MLLTSNNNGLDFCFGCFADFGVRLLRFVDSRVCVAEEEWAAALNVKNSFVPGLSTDVSHCQHFVYQPIGSLLILAGVRHIDAGSIDVNENCLSITGGASVTAAGLFSAFLAK